MKNKIFINLMSAILMSSLPAMAGSRCMGETRSGKVVSVSVKTVGTMAYVDSAWIEIKDKKTGRIEAVYALSKSEIPQYAEAVVGPDYSRANILMDAYANTLWSISIKYMGKDFSLESEGTNLSLEGWLLSPTRNKQSGNRMEVWDGRSDSDDYRSYKFQDVVCELDHDV